MKKYFLIQIETKKEEEVKLDIEAFIRLEFGKCMKLPLELMKVQARATARLPVRAKIHFPKTLPHYVLKQKNHYERCPKPTMEKCLIQTTSFLLT